MFTLRSFESMPSVAWGADPWATCSPAGGCRYQARPSYAYIPVTTPAVPVVRRAVPPRPIELQNRVRIVREQRGVAVLVELPGFSKNDIKIDVLAEQMTITAATAPSRHYPRGSIFNQSFRLGTNINADAISASLEGGVLTVRMPYKAPKPTGPRRVVISGPGSPPRQAVSIPAPATAEKSAQPAAPPATPTAAVHQKEEPTADKKAQEGEQFFYFEFVAKPEAEQEPEAAADADTGVLPPLEDNLPEENVQKKVSIDVEEDGSIEECDV